MNKITINIKADKKIKEKAQKTAKDLGMPLSVIINAYLNQFIRTKEVYFSLNRELKPSVKKRLNRLEKEAREGKNLSPILCSDKEVEGYLDSLNK